MGRDSSREEQPMPADPGTLVARIETVLERIHKIQRAIAATGEPPSRFQIEELKELGREFEALNATLKEQVARYGANES